MRTVQYLMSSDPKYESNFNNRKFAISSTAKINGMKYTDWMAKAEGEMNGNGFKFGSKTTQKSTSVKRTADFSIAFNHKSKGFDNNNSEKCTGYITNFVSFNNNINYQLPYTFAKCQITGVGTQLKQTNLDKTNHLKLLETKMLLLKLYIPLEIKYSATAELTNSPIVSTLTV